MGFGIQTPLLLSKFIFRACLQGKRVNKIPQLFTHGALKKSLSLTPGKLPGNKGVTLTREQFNEFKSIIDEVDKLAPLEIGGPLD